MIDEADGEYGVSGGVEKEAAGQLEGARASVLLEDPGWEDPEPAPFARRIYSLEELEGILADVGLSLAGVYDESGAERPPDAGQWEIYVEATKG